MGLYLYTERDTFLHRLDGLTKMFLFGANCALALRFVGAGPLLGLAVLVLLQAAAARSLCNLRRVALFLLVATVFTIALWSLTGRGSTPLFLWIKKEGLISGIAAALRIDVFFLAGMVFLSTTRNEEMVQALRRLRIPYPVCFAFSIALRLAPTFVGTGWAVRQAQSARGLDPDAGSIPERMRKAIPLLVPTFLSTIRMTGQLAMALESKGFGIKEKRTFFLASRPGVKDAAAVAVAVAILAALWGIR
jgi:energy-coupling factor transport system permease protein